MRLTIEHLQLRLNVDTSGGGKGVYGPATTAKFMACLTNKHALAATDADFERVAADLGVTPKHIRAVRKIEAPRGPYNDDGQPNILYERHKFRAHCVPPGRFDADYRDLSGPPYGAGGYGPYSVQYDRLNRAMKLDPEAALRACSWGAFQVLGENAEGMGYPSTLDFVLSLTKGEGAHLDSFAAFIRMKRLEEELYACKAGDPESCIPFVQAYNGAGFRQFNYHIKFAEALK